MPFSIPYYIITGMCFLLHKLAPVRHTAVRWIFIFLPTHRKSDTDVVPRIMHRVIDPQGMDSWIFRQQHSLYVLRDDRIPGATRTDDGWLSVQERDKSKIRIG